MKYFEKYEEISRITRLFSRDIRIILWTNFNGVLSSCPFFYIDLYFISAYLNRRLIIFLFNTCV